MKIFDLSELDGKVPTVLFVDVIDDGTFVKGAVYIDDVLVESTPTLTEILKIDTTDKKDIVTLQCGYYTAFGRYIFYHGFPKTISELL